MLQQICKSQARTFDMSDHRSLSCKSLMAGVPHLATNATNVQLGSMDVDAMIAAAR